MRLEFWLTGLVFAAELAAAPAIRAWHTRGNTTVLELSGGSAEVEFLSSSTFRFLRCQPGASCPSRPSVREKVDVTTASTSGSLELRTEYLRVIVDRSDCTLQVRKTRGSTVMLREVAGSSVFEWAPVADEQFWGLGIRTGAEWNLRGRVERTARPLVISSLGYGLFLSLPGQYEFDLRNSIRISGGFVRDRVEFFFYYGPSPKEVLTEHRMVAGALAGIDRDDTTIQRKAPAYATHVGGDSLPSVLEQLGHASFSGVLAPAIPLNAAIARTAAWLPILTHSDPQRSDPNVARLRDAYRPYILTYLWEARDRGVPAFRPLALQFPEDPEAFRCRDAFMLGDEILIASGDRTYLPRGIWTDLRSNRTLRGKQVVDTRGEGTAVYARNGTILPLTVGATIQLHYFPRLAAEFFLAEPEADAYTKAHAGPAGDYLRLEVEPVASHDFEWVVHNVSSAVSLTATGVKIAAGSSRYDEASKNLHVRLRGEAGADAIINVILKTPIE